MTEFTHIVDGDRWIQVVSPARPREILDADGSDYSRPADFGPDDQWDCGDNNA